MSDTIKEAAKACQRFAVCCVENATKRSGAPGEELKRFEDIIRSTLAPPSTNLAH